MNYSLAGLLDQIDLGVIGLPDIQRPFVWKTVKVRDLFDSMYRGFPVGYLLFWENVVEPGARPIGVGDKQVPPQLLIVDGQQRLTSLYAIVKGKPIINDDFEKVRLRIAFRPHDERFEVTNPAIEKDSDWIPDISRLWGDEIGLIAFINEFVERIEVSRDVPTDERKRYEEVIERLKNLVNFPFTALVLSSGLDEEEVSEIFVRINSEGVNLKQADFILTLMSVFWEKGRKELEEFCRVAKMPSTSSPSPFNYFIQPSPDQLLRVSVALAFRRARLEHVYSILRGKDLQTRTFSADLRDKQFSALQVAQEHVLDLTNWHEFFKCVMTAGYRGSRMVASQTNLMYSYAMWLLGRVDFGVDLKRLRAAIARWFYMTSVTSRYTGSSETQMEADLARFRSLQNADEYLAELDRICSSELTTDLWEIRLPNDLERATARQPALFSYYAALCVLGASVLFSKMKVTELLDPAVKSKKSAIERHHLFPRAFLESIGVKSLQEINQVANFALVEWSDNIAISASSPVEYYPIYMSTVAAPERSQIEFWHALPRDWHEMDYPNFLEARRQLMARVVRAAWDRLEPPRALATKVDAADHAPEHWSVEELLERRESSSVEFKSSARWDYRRNDRSKDVEDAVVRTVAGFMNRYGGTLLIGVDDDANILGLTKDLATISRGDRDGYENWLTTLLENSLGKARLGNVSIAFVDIDGEYLCRVDTRKSATPVFADTSKGKRLFFLRTNNSTRELNAQEAHEYIAEHFSFA
ncbi:MAG TPA: DUF262 domain-containing protein [Acidimicrobiia bacterium]|nr:DUF262 domain-containing protein [Acidimicrobiia bacterium]